MVGSASFSPRIPGSVNRPGGRPSRGEPGPQGRVSTPGPIDMSNSVDVIQEAGAVMARVPGAMGAPEGAGSDDVALAASGDCRAFERLYRAHAARVHTLARRMMGAEHADDLTQDIFVRAWERLGSFRGESAFGTWLHRVAVNVILNRRASRPGERGRVGDPEPVLAALPARRGGADLVLDFEDAVARLPEGARTVFVLHDVEGYRHEEIAGLLGVTAGTSKAQLHRARLLLRRSLDR